MVGTIRMPTVCYKQHPQNITNMLFLHNKICPFLKQGICTCICIVIRFYET
jgi:hypothetical protein